MPQEIQRSESGSSDSIDYAARDKWLVEQAGIPTPEVITGYVSHVVELGLHEQPDGKIASDIPESEEEAFLAEEKVKHPDSTTYFATLVDYDTKQKKRFKCYKQKPCSAVAIIVDFPDIMIDWSTQFDGGQKKPLRMILGGKQWNKEKRKFGCKQFAMKESKAALDAWSLHPKSALYQILSAAKLGEAGKPITANTVFALPGKSLQFEVAVFLKKLDDGREFLEESCKFKAGLPRGQEQKETITDCRALYFDDQLQDGDAEEIKQLKINVKQSIKWATNYEESTMQQVLDGTSTPSSDDIEEDLPF